MRNSAADLGSSHFTVTAPWIREHYKDDAFIIVERGYANENGDGSTCTASRFFANLTSRPKSLYPFNGLLVPSLCVSRVSDSSQNRLTPPPQLKGIIDTATGYIDFELGSTVPLFGYTKLTALKGNLRNGIVGTYDSQSYPLRARASLTNRSRRRERHGHPLPQGPRCARRFMWQRSH